MAKRFTDSNKYKNPFFRTLKGPYKLLWDFLYHDCDHAGIWIVNFEIAQISIGKDMRISQSEALKLFNTDEMRVIEVSKGQKWFLPGFIEFQYGRLSEKNRAHSSVISQLQKYDLLDTEFNISPFVNIQKPLTSPLQGGKEQDMDMEEDMDKDKGVQGGDEVPSINEVMVYAGTLLETSLKAYEFSIKAKYEAWKANDWKDGNDKKIKNWKTKLANTIPHMKPNFDMPKKQSPLESNLSTLELANQKINESSNS